MEFSGAHCPDDSRFPTPLPMTARMAGIALCVFGLFPLQPAGHHHQIIQRHLLGPADRLHPRRGGGGANPHRRAPDQRLAGAVLAHQTETAAGPRIFRILLLPDLLHGHRRPAAGGGRYHRIFGAHSWSPSWRRFCSRNRWECDVGWCCWSAFWLSSWWSGRAATSGIWPRFWRCLRPSPTPFDDVLTRIIGAGRPAHGRSRFTPHARSSSAAALPACWCSPSAPCWSRKIRRCNSCCARGWCRPIGDGLLMIFLGLNAALAFYCLIKAYWVSRRPA